MTNRMPTPPEARKVIVGVDTHKHVHVAVAIDSWGIRLALTPLYVKTLVQAAWTISWRARKSVMTRW